MSSHHKDFIVRPQDKTIQNDTDKFIPEHPFSMCLLGQRGTSKTTYWYNMLTKLSMFKGQFNIIKIWSPMGMLDEKIQKLMTVKGVLAEPKEKKISTRCLWKPVHDKSQSKFNSCVHEVYEVYEDTYMLNFEANMKKMKQSGPIPKTLIIVDDSLALGILNNKKTNTFVRLGTICRHINASLIVVTHTYKSLPVTLRTQMTAFVLFQVQIPELEKFWEEFMPTATFDEFREQYQKYTNQRFSYIQYNAQNTKKFIVNCDCSFSEGHKACAKCNHLGVKFADFTRDV